MENLFERESGMNDIEFSNAGGRRKECKAQGLKPGSAEFKACLKGEKAKEKGMSRADKNAFRKQANIDLNAAIAEGKVQRTGFGKAWALTKRLNPAFAIMRAPFLFLIRINAWGMATKLANLEKLSVTNKQALEAWDKILAHWVKFGGQLDKLKYNVDKGKHKKELLVRRAKQVKLNFVDESFYNSNANPDDSNDSVLTDDQSAAQNQQSATQSTGDSGNANPNGSDSGGGEGAKGALKGGAGATAAGGAVLGTAAIIAGAANPGTASTTAAAVVSSSPVWMPITTTLGSVAGLVGGLKMSDADKAAAAAATAAAGSNPQEDAMAAAEVQRQKNIAAGRDENDNGDGTFVDATVNKKAEKKLLGMNPMIVYVGGALIIVAIIIGLVKTGEK